MDNQTYDCVGRFGFIFRVVQEEEQLQASQAAAAAAGETLPFEPPSQSTMVYTTATSRHDETSHSTVTSQKPEVLTRGNLQAVANSDAAVHSKEAQQTVDGSQGGATAHSRVTEQDASVHSRGAHLETVMTMAHSRRAQPAAVVHPVISRSQGESLFSGSSHQNPNVELSSDVALGDGTYVPEDVMLDDGAQDDDIEKKIEFESLLKDLRQVYLTTPPGEQPIATADVDAALNSLSGYSDLYFQYLNSDEQTSPSNLKGQVLSRMDNLRGRIQQYQQEIQLWDEIEADKEKVVEESKKTFDAERDVDFSQLHTDDVETLRTYLTPSQLAILQQSFPEHLTSELLEAIDGRLDSELRRIQNRCQLANSKLKLNHLESADEDTPRTVFRALKSTHISH